MNTVIDYAPAALAILGGLITILAVIAPLTKSDLDNRALAGLRKIADMLGRLLGANVAARVKP
jgi:hypothetical protein